MSSGPFEPNGLRSSAPRHDLIQHADHALGWERGINLNGQAISHPFIQHVQGAKPAAPIQGVAHEIDSPHRIGLWEHDEWLAKTNRQPLLRPSRQIQAQVAIHAP